MVNHDYRDMVNGLLKQANPGAGQKAKSAAIQRENPQPQKEIGPRCWRGPIGSCRS
jgi:hypothetical protein